MVEYFKAHPEFTLHVVGNADSDFIHTMGMDQCTNIHFYGFIDTSSEQFRGIARKCSFLVYPSCTEGGVPGAVINSMLYGIVPIVTRWAAFDEVENLGYLLEDMTIEAIVMAIDWSQSLSEREVAH